MKEYKRKIPAFSLCGLNCSLCPRFHTDGPSKCPGCGGEDFSLKHPSCAVVTCNKKHDNVEFCFECNAYPCKKYSEPSAVDSFISYRNVLKDIEDAKYDLGEYLNVLKLKQEILEELIANYNDGKSKGFYCIAVNLLSLQVLNEIAKDIKGAVEIEKINAKERAKRVTSMMKDRASEMGIELTLRKHL
ncbi:MAG: DUF3795 domain-containing protein [Clostridia bacterium]|nr:DUF3795 domain-containing protein [Clostridia bacterium]